VLLKFDIIVKAQSYGWY